MESKEDNVAEKCILRWMCGNEDIFAKLGTIPIEENK